MNAQTAPPLVLASGSPRRRELLAQMGLPFEVAVSDVPETLDPSLAPEAQAVALAERKARAVAPNVPDALILGADTIVVLDREILGKPADEADAGAMLRRLAGREHQVITGLALIDVASGEVRRAAVETTVHMRPLTDEDIAAYVATGEPADKAGAYAIQGLGNAPVDRIDGCWTNVVGLPLCAVAELFTASGVSRAEVWGGCRLPTEEPCPRQAARAR